MWVIYESMEKKELTSKAGKPYVAWSFEGTKKGMKSKGEPDTPYQRSFFDNQLVTVIEKGVVRPNVPVVQFIQKACKPGDQIELKFDRSGTMPVLTTVRNMSDDVPVYEPLSDEEATQLLASQNSGGSAVAPGANQSAVPSMGNGAVAPAQHATFEHAPVASTPWE